MHTYKTQLPDNLLTTTDLVHKNQQQCPPQFLSTR